MTALNVGADPAPPLLDGESAPLPEGADPRCVGTNADGSRCAVPLHMLTKTATGDWWCFNHDPARAGAAMRAKIAGAAGAAARLRKGFRPGELPPLDSLTHAKSWLAKVAEAVATGKLSAPAGRTVMAAVTLWTKAHTDEAFGERLAQLERRVKGRSV